MQKIALVGNPNTGKTTLFNSITNLNEHVGNWHGVTVAEKEATITFNNTQYSIIDLPGTYSLNSFSYEEEITSSYLKNNELLLLNVVDGNNLNRNLFLTLELLVNGYKPILIINMANELNKNGIKINAKKLEQSLGIKVYLIDAKVKKDVKDLFYKIINNSVENETSKCVQNLIKQEKIYNVNSNKNYDEVVANRYNLVNEIYKNCVEKNNKKIYGFSKLDKVLLNKYLCLPIFLLIIATVFYITFMGVGKVLSEGLNNALNNFVFNPLINLINSLTVNQFVINLLTEGVIGSTISILSFLPQIILLFMCLNILESSGYMSRLAFSLEDIFSKVGLSGKVVFALLMGFGCSTTASLTSRTMEDKNSKIKTAMLTPYISCSAKLPLYIVVCGAYFKQYSFLIIFLLYLLGILVSILVSYILEKTILPSKTSSFILEFPALRKPNLVQLLKLAIIDAKNFLVRVGTVILTFSCIIWIAQNCTISLKYIENDSAKSILQVIGEKLSFLFKPLGFGFFGAVSALICGIVAKEIIVSSLKIINNVNENLSDSELSQSLTNIQSAIYFNPASSLSFLVFSSMYLPCVSSIGALKKEIGCKWTIFACLLEFVITYIISFIVYKVSLVYFECGIFSCLCSIFAFLIFLISLIFVIKFIKNKNKCKYCLNKQKCNKKCIN